MKRFSIFLIGVLLFALAGQTGSLAPKAHAAADPVPPEADGWVQVSTAEQLAYIDEHQSLYLSRHIQLINDIDMSGNEWIPFGGNGEAPFSGTFDGSGYRISNIRIPIASLPYVGFFGQSSGVVKNLGVAVDIEGGTFTSDGSTFTGGLIGELNGGRIDRCYVLGKVVGVNATTGPGAIASTTGGMVGAALNSSITSSFSTATVIGASGPNRRSGGLAGTQGVGTISNVYARGDVTNPVDYIGGVVGFIIYANVDTGYATGKVSSQGSMPQGGFAGSSFSGTKIRKSYFDTEATGQANGVGIVEGTPEVFSQTTAQMKQQSTYSDWDFVHTWAIHPNVNDGYPYLRPAILTAALPDANKDAPYSLTLTAFDGALGGLTWQATGLPAGMSLNANGVLQGTPRQSGSFNIELTATDAGQASATATLELVVKEAAPDITSLQISPGSAVGTTKVTAVPGQSNHSFAYRLSSLGNARPWVWDALPAEATAYTLGSDIPNVQAGQYLEVYEVDSDRLIQAWQTVQLTDADILSAIPVGLQATAEEEKVNLSWQPLGGVESYRIYTYEGSDMPADPDEWTLVNENEVTQAAYVVNHLTAGKRYWFAVTSVTQEEESGFSTPAAAIPYTTVTGVVTPADIKVGKGIQLDDLKKHFPEKVQVRVKNQSLLDVNVNWDWEQTDYDPDQAGTYKVVGQLQLPAFVHNPATVQPALSVVVLKNTIARLNGIYVDDTLLQGFQPDIFTYTLEVSYATERLTVTAATYDAAAAYEVLGGNVQTLEVGNNPIKLSVTAEDQTEQSTYTINVKRQPDSEAPRWPGGSELTVSDIAPTSAELTWPSATDHAGVSGYRIYVNDNERETVSGSVYGAAIRELTENTTYTFKIVAFDAAGNVSEALSQQATTVQSPAGGGYVLSGNADLTDLQVWGEVEGEPLKLSPSFAPGTTAYTARTEAEQVSLVPIKADISAKVTLDGKAITDSVKVDLTDEDNLLVLTVQAENGIRKEYRLSIYREQTKPAAPLVELTDIAGHWAEGSIKQAVSQKIVGGYPDGTFKPDNAVSRAEFTVMLADALKLDGNGAAATFTDNDQIGQWAKRAVALTLQMEIVNGYQDGSFRPDKHITRAEMATMIAHALKLPRNVNATTSFADDEDIPAWAKGAVEAIQKLGIANGRGGNQFVPNDAVTRSEAVVMLLKMLEVQAQM
ncbi:S-layer homology domain-containing protein [Cohnella sp. GbtcB17]|uniref:S-layer homology domain-containing protein n=1 Tax=Cohnella sp. GbtcB17 TaxID=2824762 RepID=UPI001C304528|nr:S-layer homology domain-containing protein [Cohnella sp. GbtcB17]